MTTFPICPTCDGKGWILNGAKSKRHHYKYHNERPPCRDCNGSGIVSLMKLECIMKRRDGDTLELECRIKTDDD